MTAEEKAKELVDKYYGICDEYVVFGDYHKKQLAKKSALIAVDEILEVIEDNSLEYDDNYWQEVKNHLNNM